MNDNSLVSIIILNYNAGQLLLDCVKSIQKSTYQNLEIIVVDNISKDNSHTKCKEEFLISKSKYPSEKYLKYE